MQPPICLASIPNHLNCVWVVYRHAAYHKYSDYLAYLDCASYAMHRQFVKNCIDSNVRKHKHDLCCELVCKYESILLGIKSHAQRLHKTKLNCILSIACS